MRNAKPGGAHAVEITVVCPVTSGARDLEAVHREYREVLARTGRSAEFIYILDGPWREAEASLARIREDRHRVRVLTMARGFGEAAALQFAFEEAEGRHVLTIPDRRQIEAGVVLEVLERLDAGSQVVVTRREPRRDALLNRIEARLFHGLVRRLVGQDFRDMTSGVRGFTVEAARRLDLYGNQQYFIPVIAARHGYTVVEIPCRQHPGDGGLRVHGPGVYVRRALDILSIFFLMRFTRKPLRFFGLIGSGVGSAGLVICGVLAFRRLFLGYPLADRPLLLLGVLLLLLGLQVISIGLLGELIIFLSSRRDLPVVREMPPGGEEPRCGEGEEA